jgi:hypothetical protein
MVTVPKDVCVLPIPFILTADASLKS